MTKKDYVKIAEIVRVAKTRVAGISNETIYFFETELADLFARDNVRFDRERFTTACKPS